jgi:hypothetical protein
MGARGRTFVYENYTRSAGTGKIIKALMGVEEKQAKLRKPV